MSDLTKDQVIMLKDTALDDAIEGLKERSSHGAWYNEHSLYLLVTQLEEVRKLTPSPEPANE